MDLVTANSNDDRVERGLSNSLMSSIWSDKIMFVNRKGMKGKKG